MTSGRSGLAQVSRRSRRLAHAALIATMMLSLMPWNSVALAADESHDASASVEVAVPAEEPVVVDVPAETPVALSEDASAVRPEPVSPCEGASGAGAPAGPPVTSEISVFVPGAVSGRAVDSTGLGVGGIVVQVQDIGTERLVMAEMMTSSDGAFVLSGVPAGVYKLAMLDLTWRYVSGYLGGDSFESASDVVVAAGGTTSVGTVDMAAWCYVNGDLYDWTGSEPVFGATVRAYVQAGEEWDVVASTRTADNGGWSVRLPEGVYRIGYQSPSDASVLYHPAADEIDSEQDVVVTRAGAWLSARLLSPDAPLSGSATLSDDGRGVQGMRIDLSPVDGGSDFSATTDEHGLFSQDVTPGSYKFEAAFPDGGFAFVSGMTAVTVYAGTVIVGPEGAFLDLVVVPVATLRGTISDKV
ncbi:MAG: carboxypeptidase-like regulatory domain-containing protein, partial [Coriobacteriia bacterium]|nr:carboxypeptidase-like regulatory domain-containing protein [Coriobacteriia bacterium]